MTVHGYDAFLWCLCAHRESIVQHGVCLPSAVQSHKWDLPARLPQT